jgi:hypothetical protein
MNLLNPHITIDNAEDGFWLVGFRHQFDEHQVIDIRVTITKMPDQPVIEILRAALNRMNCMLPAEYRHTG